MLCKFILYNITVDSIRRKFFYLCTLNYNSPEKLRMPFFVEVIVLAKEVPDDSQIDSRSPFRFRKIFTEDRPASLRLNRVSISFRVASS